MIFGGKESREEILAILNSQGEALDNAIFAANIGACFCAISSFESLIASLVSMSSVEVGKAVPRTTFGDAAAMIVRLGHTKGMTVGRLVTSLEKHGVAGRPIVYLRAILELRNDFIHRLQDQVPLPGDWLRYSYTLEESAEYTRYVLRHICHAQNMLPTILMKLGVLSGTSGDYGSLLWNSEDNLFGDAEEESGPQGK